MGMGEFYALREKSGTFRRASRPPAAKAAFAYLDDPEFLRLYSEVVDGERRMTFYLEGIHCLACLWLLQKVPEFAPGVRRVEIDAGRSTARVVLDLSAKAADAAGAFELLGYRPHAVREREDEELRRREDRLLLMRVAVAGACAMNIMLLAISDYAGASGSLLNVFRWTSFALFLPVLGFSAAPLFRSAWASLRARSVSIDVPVCLGLSFGFLSSAVNLLRGSGGVYFDSLSTLVFLLLAGRLVLARAQRGAVERSRLLHFLTPSMARVLRAGDWKEVALDSVKPGERVEIRAGEAVPVDGVVDEGRSHVDASALTGESLPRLAAEGAALFAGTTNLDAPLRARVTACGYRTRLGRILEEVERASAKPSQAARAADHAGKYFVGAVLTLSAAAFAIGLRHGPAQAFQRALATAIVTCPCGLALATPLAQSIAIGRAAAAGILIKGADALERLGEIDEVFLDKTGTLTEGALGVVSWEAEDSAATLAAAALESRSAHPIARAIFARLSESVGPLPEVKDFREVAGEGVSGRIDGVSYGVGADEGERGGDSASPGSIATAVAVTRGGRIVARAHLSDRLRADAAQTVAALRAMGLRVRVLSGDSPAAAAEAARILGLTAQDAIGAAMPEDKKRIVSASPRAMMVGDGANDAVALASAFVGVAAHGGMEVSLRAADAYLSRPGTAPIAALVRLGRGTRTTIMRNLIFSAAYNLIGAALALSGRVGPLFAAVLMPLSAITVFVSSMLGAAHARAALEALP